MNKFLTISFLSLSLSLSSCSGGGSDNPAPGPEGPDSGGTTQKTQTVRYTSTDENFFNPERGFYTEVESNMTVPMSEARLVELKRDKKSLVQILYYLKDRRDRAFSEADIRKIKDDMATVRKVGLKIILRFAYTSSATEPDAPMRVIKQHLDQLKPLLTDNKDVIACVQAGFIGAWGEWYYSSNDLNNTASRNEVLTKWLEVLPSDRCIQVRTPAYKKNFTGSQTPLDDATAYNGTPMARIAHHNDAFMADATNMGTYEDVTKDKDYLAKDGLYVPVGGETCRTSSTATPSHGAEALQDLKYLHWSFLNDAYDKVVLQQWEKDGQMAEIRLKLGYRIVLTRGEYSTKHIPGSTLNVKLSLQNIGFAAMYNPRKVQLILRSTDGTTEYVAALGDDPRAWKPLRATTLTADVALPADLPAGDYKLFLFLPDAESSISARADYAVRLANKDMWEAATGYNNLGVTIKVDKTGSLPKSTSSIRFIKK
ncbi:DUF4832 domain-containing protein [Prevotella sp. A2931]|uniref:DUF4832 domain-containing protein n=1 Tax=Prevotella illustrans TaxID=2800387 RepID=A0ABS3M4L0_9BACT|nr:MULTISPECIES: DUF4832 domain-containing protein [Prevotella]MBO1363117.1 DUF4832 domain-containing protein [Prevotella illustrans]PTL26160.1 hypothetical protein C3V39_03245 [Prevotella sp. oral taxon 820]